MGLFKNIFTKKLFDPRFHGTWRSDIEDEMTLKIVGNVTMRFTPDGKLYHDTKKNGTVKRVNMDYWTTELILHTQESKLHREIRSPFEFLTKDLLIFKGDQQTRFKRS